MSRPKTVSRPRTDHACSGVVSICRSAVANGTSLVRSRAALRVAAASGVNTRYRADGRTVLAEQQGRPTAEDARLRGADRRRVAAGPVAHQQEWCSGGPRFSWAMATDDSEMAGGSSGHPAGFSSYEVGRHRWGAVGGHTCRTRRHAVPAPIICPGKGERYRHM